MNAASTDKEKIYIRPPEALLRRTGATTARKASCKRSLLWARQGPRKQAGSWSPSHISIVVLVVALSVCVKTERKHFYQTEISQIQDDLLTEKEDVNAAIALMQTTAARCGRADEGCTYDDEPVRAGATRTCCACAMTDVSLREW